VLKPASGPATLSEVTSGAQAGPIVPKDELRATLEAQRELGPEYSDAVLESFLEHVDRRIDERIRAAAPAKRSRHSAPALIPMLALSIPLIAIAGGIAGLPGILAICAAIVLVTVVAR
jgi:hypothetical protein